MGTSGQRPDSCENSRSHEEWLSLRSLGDALPPVARSPCQLRIITGMEVRMELLSLPKAIAVFLDDLRRAERSAHTVRAYTTELRHLVACHDGPVATIAVDTLRAALARRDGRSPAGSRARTLAALNSFLHLGRQT